MIRSLRVKFVVLLFAVSAIALSAAFLLRELMLRDFRAYLEGEREDRVYWVTAHLERSYERHRRWDRGALADEVVRALLMGFEARVRNARGAVVMDTDSALASLSPLMRRRVQAMAPPPAPEGPAGYIPYPLFLAGTGIGGLEVRFREPGRDVLYIRQSRQFLLWSLLALGGVALLLSVVAAGALTRSLARLSAAAAAVGKGDLSPRVPARGGDEIAALAAAFNRMAEALEVQEVLRKKLVTNLAHELRTPLGALRAELEAMMDGVLPLDREHLASLQEETDRLRRMLEGIDDLAQAQASALTLVKRAVELGPFLENIAGRMRHAARQKGVQLTAACPPGTTALADPDRLGQVVLNLLSNALRATPAGGRIEVRGRARDAETVLEVEDTGRGIDPKDLPFIFERFYRSHGGGLGLGLAIVRELVEAHGGTVVAERAPSGGARFTVTLPGGGVHNSS